MSIINIRYTNFDSVVDQNKIVLIDCWASWCDACAKFKPVFESVARKYPEIIFAMLDATKEKEILKELKIEHIPTLLLFRDGILLFKQPGYYEEEQLEDILKQAAELDMDLVKKEIEAEKAYNK